MFVIDREKGLNILYGGWFLGGGGGGSIGGGRNVLEAVLAGGGISVLSSLAVENEVKAGVLQAGAFTEGEILRRVDFIYTADGDQKFINEFIRFSRKRMGRSLIRVPGR